MKNASKGTRGSKNKRTNGKSRGRVAGQPMNDRYKYLIADNSTIVNRALHKLSKKHGSQKDGVQAAILSAAGMA